MQGNSIFSQKLTPKMGGRMEIYMKLTDVLAVTIGHAVGDALGVPCEFASRDALIKAPITKLEGYGTYKVPAGSWSDDTSMAIATLDSLKAGYFDPNDIMKKFGDWYFKDAYTPTGEMFDVGGTCSAAISNYFSYDMPYTKCGLSDEYSCGNGSLMRIHPAVLYALARDGALTDRALGLIYSVSDLTHSHRRVRIGCGIYAYILSELLKKPSRESIYTALSAAREKYESEPEFSHYARIFDNDFENTSPDKIKSGGYIVETLEAAIWCLLRTSSYSECVLLAVNLGEDTDTTGAVTGGLAGALYGYEGIPELWRHGLIKRDYLEEICCDAYNAWNRYPENLEICDLHMHIVPGVDDGATDMSMALEMLDIHYTSGVRKIFCTSHSDSDSAVMRKYRKNLTLLSSAEQEHNRNLHLYSGCEILFTKCSIKSIISRLKKNILPTLNGGRYVMAEFDIMETADVIIDTVKTLLSFDYIPIIAHAERYVAMDERPLASELIGMGALFQINAYSLVPEVSEEIRERARRLLSSHSVHFIGSDAHRLSHRPPDITEGVRYIFYTVDEDYARDILYRNAEKYILTE